MREKGLMHKTRDLYESLGECLDMFYVDRYAWKLKEQSDNYAEVMTRVSVCLKQAYAACQTQKRVYVYVPYDTYATFVDICHMCGRYVHDTEMTQYVKMSREPYTDRQKKELHIIELEDLQAKVVDANSFAHHWQHLYYELRSSSETEKMQLSKELRDERVKVTSLNTEIAELKLKNSAEVARLKTEIVELKRKRSPPQNAEPKPPQEDSAVKPRSDWFPWLRRAQCSPVSSLLADLSHLSVD
jgi:hypothetical protein